MAARLGRFFDGFDFEKPIRGGAMGRAPSPILTCTILRIIQMAVAVRV